jgi:RNA polymerase sigma factor (sigma-70 family)
MHAMITSTKPGPSLDDAAGFGVFYGLHAESVLVFFTRRTYDVETSLDLTAETFAQAFASRGRLRAQSDGQAAAWLFAIASHQLSSYQRRGHTQRRLLRRLGLEVPAAGEAETERILELAGLRPLRAVIARELGRLSEEQRRALELRVVDELSYAVVAQRLGISEQAARMRVSRGLGALARALDVAPKLSERPA